MDAEKVTDELVQQNGNQAAAVMSDYTKKSIAEAKEAIYLKEGTTVYEVKIVSGELTATAVE